MAQACGCHGHGASSDGAVLDVREMPPRVRHPKIFETFDALAPGASFVLVNDHDPKPLFYQFQFERPKTAGWRYLEEGPEVWRVEITKLGPAMVDADQTVAAVLEAHPGLRPLLQDLGINHCCGAHLTLKEAAASAGIALDRVLQSIGERLATPAPVTAGPRPAALDAVPEPRRVLVDVREDIRRGAEPFARIMGAVKDLRSGEVLVLRAPFEPIPLYGVLGKRGFAHWTESLASDDWRVTFYRDPAAAPERPASPPPEPLPTELDVRGLEPPHPLVRVLEALDRLGPGGELVVLHERRPVFLYPQLEARGFAHETDEPTPGVIRIRIRHAAAAPESAAGR